MINVDTVVHVDADGLRFVVPDSDQRFAWGRYRAAVIVPEGVALVLAAARWIRLIPISAFASADDARAWAALAQRAIEAAVEAGGGDT